MELIGYRIWRFSCEGRLFSAGLVGNEWFAGKNEAICILPEYPLSSGKIRGYGKHLAPDAGCKCGFYSFKNLRDAVAEWLRSPDRTLIGKVLLWGKVIEHSKGYRSQFAYVDEIFKVALCPCCFKMAEFVSVSTVFCSCHLPKFGKSTSIDKFWQRLGEKFKVVPPPENLRVISSNIIKPKKILYRKGEQMRQCKYCGALFHTPIKLVKCPFCGKALV